MALPRCGYGGHKTRRAAHNNNSTFGYLPPWRCESILALAFLSLHDAVGGLRLQFDFAKSGFVLRDVLLENPEQRLGLLRADVYALKIVDGDVLRRSLVHPAEHEQENPQIRSEEQTSEL